MARAKLTATLIAKAKCPVSKKQSFLWDEKVRGLGVRVTASTKVFIYQGRFGDGDIRVKIGDTRTWAIGDARKKATQFQTLIDKGLDPRVVKRERTDADKAKKKEYSRQEVILADVWPVYIEDRKQAWSPRHYADHVRIVHLGGEEKKRGKGKTKPGALAALMPVKLCDLTAQKVKSWAANESLGRATQTRIAFEALRAFLNWCNDHPDYKNLASPEACSARIKKKCLPKKAAKTDCLQREQLNAWFSAVKGYQNRVISAYLQTLLLTGARREELTHLKWSEVDFKWQSMTIHDKVEEDRTIPLTPYVSSLLSSLPKRNKWVFSSPAAKSGRLQEPRIPHNKALAIAGIDHLTLHGLRRSFGTLSEWVEVPAGVVAQIMGHKPSATVEKHYRQRPLDLLRMWHVKIEGWILEQAGVEQPEKTIKTPTLKLRQGGAK